MADEIAARLKREWYVLHVKPRTEKKVFSYLESYSFYRYLPLLEKITKVQRRKVRTLLPLFPGYVFTKLNRDERLTMLKTNLIVNMIGVSRPREMVHQLRQVARATKHGAAVHVTCPFKVGDLVRVKYGPFRGLEGFIKREAGSASIVVNLDIIGQAVETSIAAADCEAVEKE